MENCAEIGTRNKRPTPTRRRWAHRKKKRELGNGERGTGNGQRGLKAGNASDANKCYFALRTQCKQ